MTNLNLTLTTTAPNETVVIERLKLTNNGTVNWGDGNSTNLTGGTGYDDLSHTYVSAGTYSAVISDADDVTEIYLSNSKISNFDTGDLSGADVSHFKATGLGSGCVVDSSDMTGWTGVYWYLYAMPSGTYNIDTSDMTGWTGGYWYLHTMPSGTYNIDTSDMTGWEGRYWFLYSMPSGTYNIDSSDITGWVGHYWKLHTMPSGTYNIDTSDMTGWDGTYWSLYSMPSGTYNIDSSDMTGWIGGYWWLYSMPSGTYNIDSSDMTGWIGYFWYLYSMPSGTYNIDTSDMTGWGGRYWSLYSMPSGTYNFSEACFQFWTSSELIYAYDCIDSVTGANVFTQEVVDRIINDIYQGKLRYSGTPQLNIGGTNATPSATGLAQIAELEAGYWSAFQREDNPIYHKSDWGVIANETNVTSGPLENTPYEVLTGTFKVVTDTYNSRTVKVIECVSTGTLKLPLAMGTTWNCYIDTGSGYAFETSPAFISSDVLSMNTGEKIILGDMKGDYCIYKN